MRVLDRMIGLGLKLSGPPAPAGYALAGKTFVITGTLPTLSRKDAESAIQEMGGKVSGSVSAKTDFLLCGTDAGSKLEKARQLGIKIIDENEFQEMIKI
jgi:DNA ligase (NAD+)